jgi:hypothetical protein
VGGPSRSIDWQHGAVSTASAGPAGYSGTALPRKLGIGPGSRVLVVGTPRGWDAGQLDPEGVAQVSRRAARAGAGAAYDVVVAFCPDRAALQTHLARARPLTGQQGRLWLCWPKRSSGRQTDLDEAEVRRAGLAAGVVDVKICAVDATWSGLCFMTRRRDRTP